MKLDFRYRVKYESGHEVDHLNGSMTVDIPREEFERILVAVQQPYFQLKTLNDIDGIPTTLSAMTDAVTDADCYYDLKGRLLKKPLQKARKIAGIDFYLTEFDQNRIRRMKNPLQVFGRPKESMTIWRNDDTSVKISYENGLVCIHDSASGRISYQEADHFLNSIT